MIYENREYQDDFLKSVFNFYEKSSFKKGIGVSPVGTGKSLYPSAIAKEVNEPTLVIQPSKELLEQNVEKAQAFGLDPSVYSASMKSKVISDLTYATPMSIVNNEDDFKHFKNVIIDEGHLALSNKMKNGKIDSKGKLSQFLEYINPDKTLCLTATPIQLVTTGRGSELKMINRSMRSYWYKSDIIKVTQIPDICEKYWADIEKKIIDNDISILEKSNPNSPEFTKESIIEQYDSNDLNNQIIEQYEFNIQNGIEKTLTFVPSVKHAMELKKINPEFEFIYDKTPSKERTALVKAFKRGDISNLLNVEIFTTGFDDPYLKGIICARETMSFQLYYQIYGRLVRNIFENGVLYKKKGLFTDLTSNTNRFGNIESLTFEKNDYTNGWGLWEKDRLLTGYPFGDWDMPKRSEFINSNTNKEDIDDITLSFGKYKGKSLKKSFDSNPSYFTWMLNEFKWTSHNMNLKHKIEKLLKQNILHGK